MSGKEQITIESLEYEEITKVDKDGNIITVKVYWGENMEPEQEEIFAISIDADGNIEIIKPVWQFYATMIQWYSMFVTSCAFIDIGSPGYLTPVFCPGLPFFMPR